jgi:hypothetical protein
MLSSVAQTFPLHSCLKQEHALSELLFNLIVKVPSEGLEKEGGIITGATHQLLVCAAAVNLLSKIIIETQIILDARREVYLEIYTTS